jgi:hypothetical protein
MAEVACFCGALFSFDAAAACPRCGALAALPLLAVPLYECRGSGGAEINDAEGPGEGISRLIAFDRSAVRPGSHKLSP